MRGKVSSGRKLLAGDVKDSLFFGAWIYSESGPVNVDMNEARLISHKHRRKDREKKLLHFDKEINFKAGNSAAIVAIEAQRQAVRDENAIIQTEIETTFNN